MDLPLHGTVRLTQDVFVGEGRSMLFAEGSEGMYLGLIHVSGFVMFKVEMKNGIVLILSAMDIEPAQAWVPRKRFGKVTA